MALTLEQKAKDLINSFCEPIYREMEWHLVAATDAAIIHVQEMIDYLNGYNGMHDQEFFDSDKAYYQSVLSYLKNK